GSRRRPDLSPGLGQPHTRQGHRAVRSVPRERVRPAGEESRLNLSASSGPLHMRTGADQSRGQIVEQVAVVAQGAEDADMEEQAGVALPDALDEHGDSATLEGSDHVAEDMGAGGVDEFEL